MIQEEFIRRSIGYELLHNILQSHLPFILLGLSRIQRLLMALYRAALLFGTMHMTSCGLCWLTLSVNALTYSAGLSLSISQLRCIRKEKTCTHLPRVRVLFLGIEKNGYSRSGARDSVAHALGDFLQRSAELLRFSTHALWEYYYPTSKVYAL